MREASVNANIVVDSRAHTPGECEVERIVPHLVEEVAAVPWIKSAIGAFGEVSLPLGSLCLMFVEHEPLGLGVKHTCNELLSRRQGDVRLRIV